MVIGRLKKLSIRAVLLIATIYVYFLIFAQFAFLKLASAAAGEFPLKGIMAAMGLAGLLGSFLAPLGLARVSAARLMALGFVGMACSAGACSLGGGGIVWMGIAAGIGLSLGIVTVTLVARLRDWIGLDGWGVTIGLGTGLAYFCCNLPWLFNARPGVQAGMAAGLGVFGIGIALGMRSNESILDRSGSSRLPFLAGLVVFTVLIWLDSAAFFIIQSNRELARGTWGPDPMLWRNGLVHLFAAVFAGVWLERRGGRGTVALLVSAFGLLAVASLCVNQPSTLWLGGALYPAGVSLYSCCLVAFPSYLLRVDEPRRRAWLSATLYAVAGWLGSGLGIGMGENLHQVPGWFIGLALMLFLAVFGRRWMKRYVREIVACAVLLLVGEAFTARSGAVGAEANQGLDLGREVYIGEGCIHCHSRYVRPSESDITLWGPYVSYEVALDEAPPLFGNRRQGPDLLNVGVRRSRAWMKAHFLDPRAFNPDSVMPRYAHLFEGDDGRGDRLLDYLARLPDQAWEERLTISNGWHLPSGIRGEASRGAGLFARHCAVCHGTDGRGQGPIASQFMRAPANLRDGPFVHTNTEAFGQTALQERLPQIIKFGLLGTDMAGHETLSDQAIADLTAQVISMRK